MLITILAWIYITVICWIYGYKFCQLLGKTADAIDSMHFSINCLIGLSFLTTVGGYLSLFTGLNNIYLHAVILLFSVVFLFTIESSSLRNIKNYLPRNSPFLIGFLIACISVVLIMSVWHIKHPDTIDYHSVIIKSIKENRIERGLALQNLRYGLQSNWFVSCALFGLDFFPFDNLTFINTGILLWLFCFAVHKIQANSFPNTGEKGHFTAILWVLFLAIAFADYTQVRLTATSASPDFPTALYILLIAFLFYSQDLTRQLTLLLIFLIATAFSQKLFSFPLIILFLYLLVVLIKKYPSSLIAALLIFLLTICPFLLRNYFTSGYILYPSSFPAISRPAWRVDPKATLYLQDYIKAYARTASSENPENVQRIVNASWNEWLPVWWNLRSISQKMMIIATALLSVLGIFRIWKHPANFNIKDIIIVAISLSGLSSWFFLAPDPRFGIAYFVLLAYSLSNIIGRHYLTNTINKKAVTICLSAFTLVLITYLAYRAICFFDAVNLVYPYGI